MGSLAKLAGIVLCCCAGTSISTADNLVDILELALENDPSLRQQRALYRANREFLIQGRATLLPSIGVGGNTSRQTSGPSDSQYFTIPSSGAVIRQDDHSFRPGINSHSWGLSVSQNVLNLSAWYTFESAKASDRAAAVNFAAQEQELIYRVATAYFDVLRAIDLLETNVQEEEAALTSLEQTRRREEVGLDTIIDVYDGQASYDLARNTTILQRNILQARYEALEAITGRAHPNIDVLREDFPIVEAEGTLNEWEGLADTNSLALANAEFTLEAQQQLLLARKSDRYPTVTLTGRYGHFVTQSIEREGIQVGGGASDSTNLALNFSLPLYQGGALSSRRRAAEYNVIAARESLELTKRQVTQNIRNAYRRVNTDVLVIAQRQQSIISAQAALDQTELGVEVGQRNIVELLRAREILYQALRNYAVARYDYVLSTLALKQISGLLSPQDVIDLNVWLETQTNSVQ